MVGNLPCERPARWIPLIHLGMLIVGVLYSTQGNDPHRSARRHALSKLIVVATDNNLKEANDDH